MGDIVVHLVSAMICFGGHCYPTLVGPATPRGDFNVVHLQTSLPGYSGDVLAFAQDDRGVFAIHRVWTLAPAQRRLERLRLGGPSARRGVTEGCINVMPEVYAALVDCCSTGHVQVTD